MVPDLATSAYIASGIALFGLLTRFAVSRFRSAWPLNWPKFSFRITRHSVGNIEITDIAIAADRGEKGVEIVLYLVVKRKLKLQPQQS